MEKAKRKNTQLSFAAAPCKTQRWHKHRAERGENLSNPTTKLQTTPSYERRCLKNRTMLLLTIVRMNIVHATVGFGFVVFGGFTVLLLRDSKSCSIIVLSVCLSVCLAGWLAGWLAVCMSVHSNLSWDHGMLKSYLELFYHELKALLILDCAICGLFASYVNPARLWEFHSEMYSTSLGSQHIGDCRKIFNSRIPFWHTARWWHRAIDNLPDCTKGNIATKFITFL